MTEVVASILSYCLECLEACLFGVFSSVYIMVRAVIFLQSSESITRNKEKWKTQHN